MKPNLNLPTYDTHALAHQMHQLLTSCHRINVVRKAHDVSPERPKLVRSITEDIRLHASIKIDHDETEYLLVLAKAPNLHYWHCYTMRMPEEKKPAHTLHLPRSFFGSWSRIASRWIHTEGLTIVRSLKRPPIKYTYMAIGNEPAELVYGFTKMFTPILPAPVEENANIQAVA